jgi:hypothetical protein
MQTDSSEDIIIDVYTKKEYSAEQRHMTPRMRINRDEKGGVDIVGYSSLYDEEEEDSSTVGAVLEKPISNLISLGTNPLALITVIYVFSLTKLRVAKLLEKWGVIQKDRMRDVPLSKEEKEKLDAQPFEIYECEKCTMQMRPAKGR